ncbi:MAG TPA: peptidylprolyl isomerase [Gammaproteobacteria bacterium]|nr:peptidylprolyl isomerase [Gammaproteobacteria bacterium]
MQIAKDTVVTLDYTLTDDQGQTLDSSEGREPLAYLHGAGTLIPGLESALEGHAEGAQMNVTVPPEDAYGNHQDGLQAVVSGEQFEGAPELEVGMQFQASTPDGTRVVTIVGIDGDDVTVDANHPLAGQTLNFDVTVREVRAATQEELEHGHAHDPGDHQH